MHPELEERAREKRHRRLAVILGLLLALFLHLFVFWGPRIRYQPLLAEAKVTRVIRARPYREEALPDPRKAPSVAPSQSRSAPRSAPVEAPAQPLSGAFTEPEAAPPPEAVAVQQGGGAPVQGLSRQEGAVYQETNAPERGEWETVMAEMEAKGRGEEKKWEVAQAPRRDSRKAAPKESGREDDTFLDPGDARIRMSVVSDPPTSIEKSFTPVPFPDVRVTRKQFTEGICRVYYRVKTDASGRIVKREIKTPATEEGRKHFAPFVDAVVRTVESWTFEREAADIHVDVYFDLAKL